MTKKIAYRCPECGSKNVIAEGPLRWNETVQVWEFHGFPYDHMACLDCEHESDHGADFEMELEA